jgi:peptide/nickel transport system substrate-binding protein
MRSLFSLAAAGIAVLLSSQAYAQKAAETVRIAINDTFAVLDSYHAPFDEAAAFDRVVYQSLIGYDQVAGKQLNILAKSLTRLNGNTLEVELRDNVVFHNGNRFDADDVKATLEYLANPATKIPFKQRYDWIKSVEILSPYKVLIHQSRSFSSDLGILAFRLRLRDKETMDTFADQTEYGKNPNGTGSYRVTSLDRNAGIAVEAVSGHWEGGKYFPQNVKRVRGVFMPDRQTQIAQLMTGNIDLVRNVSGDEAKNLALNPNLGVTATGSGNLLYVTFDAIGRSKNKVMTDKRVRQAFIQAVDRDALLKHIIPGGEFFSKNKAYCLPNTLACAPGVEVYPFDPAAAKKLLAEAGYANGFDLVLHVHEPFKSIAEAMAGEVRKVGIRASIESLTNAAYVRMRGNGEFTAFLGSFPAATHPDTSVVNEFFFSGDRDYWQDPMIQKAMEAGEVEFDDAKRARIYTPILDKANTEAYLLPISEQPTMWAHHKEVFLNRNAMSNSLPLLGDYGWKK